MCFVGIDAGLRAELKCGEDSCGVKKAITSTSSYLSFNRGCISGGDGHALGHNEAP